MCLRNLQKNLVHGALIDAEILTSPLPMYLLNWAQLSGQRSIGHWYSACVWGPNRCWDIEFHTPTCICQPVQIWVLMLCPWVCQHLSSSLKCSYVSHKPPKNLSAWGPNRCWDIDFPTPLHVFAQLDPVIQVLTMLHLWVCQHLPSGIKIFLCLSAASQKFWCMGL